MSHHISLEKIENQMISEGLKQSTPEWDIVWADRWNARWHEDENVPTAKYRIYVTDPKWIEHLSPGQTFDTAAYSDAGPWVCEDRSIEL